MPIILHISADFPDVLAPGKTKAFSSLIAAVPEHRHVVYSLNRVNGFSRIDALPSGEDVTAVAYGALPKGLLWHGRFKAIAAWILADLRAKGIAPDLVQAHKLTVEGVIGRIVAQALNVPLICDIQGDSDLHIFGKKRSLQPLYRRILAEAAVVLPLAPWATDFFAANAGLDREKTLCLPVIPGVAALSPAPVVNEDRLLSIFHLDSWRRKNITGMAAALGKLAATRPSLRLDIYGSGSAKSLMELRHALETIPGHERVHLLGPVKHEQLQGLLKQYAAFLLPSLR